MLLGGFLEWVGHFFFTHPCVFMHHYCFHSFIINIWLVLTFILSLSALFSFPSPPTSHSILPAKREFFLTTVAKGLLMWLLVFLSNIVVFLPYIIHEATVAS